MYFLAHAGSHTLCWATTIGIGISIRTTETTSPNQPDLTSPDGEFYTQFVSNIFFQYEDLNVVRLPDPL